jgi:DNA mismatch repair protein MutS
MLALLEIFKRLPYITQTLAQFDAHELRDITQMLAPPQQLRDEIEAAICDDPPFTITEGGIFKKGYDARLDELIDLATNGKQAVMRIEAEERVRSGISSLKVRYNKVFGYYIEITKANLDKTPQNYIRKQTIAGGERYITEELKDFEEKILGAEEKRKALESELFEALRQKTLSQMSALKRIARGLATLDVYNALATAAAKHNYIRPLVDSSCELAIEAGRHPVVERNLTEDRFVPNDLTINGGDERLIIITGPNMAGKSTVMRQARASG